MEHETGREPTEPTDAELLNNVRRMFRCAIFLAEADERWGGTAKRTPADRSAWEDRERWLLRLVDRVKTVTPELDANISDRLRIDPADLSGQRPMPGSEVSRAEVLRMSTDTLLKAEAERLPDTPAPDEVERLRAEVAELKLRLEGNALELDLRVNAELTDTILAANTTLTARVAELEAELARYRDAITWALGTNGEFEPNIIGRPFWWRTELHNRAGITWDGEKWITATGKEPTSGD